MCTQKANLCVDETATAISVANGFAAREPSLAVDDDERAIVVWAQAHAGQGAIWASRYQFGAGWSDAGVISSLTVVGDAGAPSVAVNAIGDGVAVWAQGDPAQIWSARFWDAGWAAPKSIDVGADGGVGSTVPKVVVDAVGNATAVWARSAAVRWNRFSVDGGWADAGDVAITSVDAGSDAGQGLDPRIAVHAASGDVVLAYGDSSGGNIGVFARTFSPLTGWGSAVRLDSASANASGARVAIGGGGDAFVVWEQSDGARSRVWGTRRAVDGGWEAAAIIDRGSASRPATQPAVAAGSLGSAVVVWRQSGVSGNDAIGSSWFFAPTGWADAGDVNNSATDRNDTLDSPAVATSESGYVFAIWHDVTDGEGDIIANRSPGIESWIGSWGVTEALGLADTGDGERPQIVATPWGRAVAAWAQESPSVFRIWVAIVW